MQQNFELFFRRVLDDEGTKYENVEGDNGGPTCCGLTIFDIARWNNIRIPDKIAAVRQCAAYPDLVEKVKAITPALAETVYKRYYWDTVRADDLPAGIDYCVVDFAVNSGPGKAVPDLGSLVGVSGAIVTDQMLRAAQAYGSLPDLVNHYQDIRKAYLERLAQIPHDMKFRSGWLERVERVRKVALEMAKSAEPLLPLPKQLPKTPTPLPVAPPHPVAQVAANKGIWATGVAGVTLVGNGFQHAVDGVGSLFGSIGDIKADVDSLVSPTSSVLQMLHLQSPKVDLAIGCVALAYAAWHHFAGSPSPKA
jgi:lysozyme family protein